MPQFEPISIKYLLTPAAWRWFVYLCWRRYAIAFLVLYHATPFAEYPWIAILFLALVLGGAIWDHRRGSLTDRIQIGREIEIEIDTEGIRIDGGLITFPTGDIAIESAGVIALRGDPRDGSHPLFPAEALTQDQRVRFIGLLCARNGAANCEIPERPPLWRSLFTDLALISLILAVALRARL